MGVQDMDYCARIVAQRITKKGDSSVEKGGVFAKHWTVDFKGFTAEMMECTGTMGKYYEKLHVEVCEEYEAKANKRKDARTKTDNMFASKLKDLPVDDEEDEEPDPNTRA